MRSTPILFTLVLSAVALWFGGAAAQRGTVHGPLADPIDWMAFYCGAKVVRAGGNPYRVEPLRSCERAALRESHLKIVPNLVVPAPLPPYALGVLAPLARLSFRTSCLVLFVVIVEATALAVLLLVRLSGLSALTIGVVLAIPTWFGSVPIGQVIPIVVAAIAAAALALRRDRPWLAALATAVAAIEPHIALPMFLALLLFVPRARVPVIVTGLVLGSLAVAVVGPAILWDYLAGALPAHALAEAGNFYAQYSATALAVRLGVAPHAAIVIGELDYAAMVALGLVLARRAACAAADASFYALVPPAIVLLGGVYAHIHLIAVALPLALTLAARPAYRERLLLVTLLLAIPWQSFFEDYLAGLYPLRPYLDPAVAMAATSHGAVYADELWRTWVTFIPNRDGRTLSELIAYKMVTWAALLALIAAVAGLSPKRTPLTIRGQPKLV